MGALSRFVVVAAVVLGLSSTVVAAAPGAPVGRPITIWIDETHAAAVSALVANGFRGSPVVVVVKDLTAIRDELPSVPDASAPDVIWADSTWTGQLVDAGSVVPLKITDRNRAAFRPSALSAFQVGPQSYGLPLQVSNLALITSVPLVPKPPTTFSELSRTALALVQAGKAKVPFAVGQGGDSDGYALYPLFSGLGGFFFGTNADGAFDPSLVGIANKTFLQNSVQIDNWKATGLINSSLTTDSARRAFANRKAPFWLAGPEDMAALNKLSFVYRITAVPPLVPGRKATPLLRIQGFMVTKFAAVHSVAELAGALAGGFMSKAPSQLAIAGAAGLIPANRTAVSQLTEKRLQAIDLAGVEGVPIPNIPQMSAVWAPYGGAWVSSTAPESLTLAKSAFRSAQRTVKATID